MKGGRGGGREGRFFIHCEKSTHMVILQRSSDQQTPPSPTPTEKFPSHAHLCTSFASLSPITFMDVC